MVDVRFEWWHGDLASGAECYIDGDLKCTIYACELPSLQRDDNPGFWSIDIPYFDLEADDMRLRPHGMGRTIHKDVAIREAEEAARRFCAGGLELVA